MGLWGGQSPGGWSSRNPAFRSMGGIKRSTDGWDDEELGKLYDHKVMRRLVPYLRPYKGQGGSALGGRPRYVARPERRERAPGAADDRPADDPRGLRGPGNRDLLLALPRRHA